MPVIRDRGLVDWMDYINGRSLTVNSKQEIHKLGVLNTGATCLF